MSETVPEQDVHRRKSKQTDLTQGKITKTILRFTFPVFLTYLLQTLFGIADAAICGYTLDANQVAGVNDTSSVSFLFLQFAIGCTSGMSVTLADSVGRRDAAGIRKAFAAQIVWGLVLSALLTVAGLFSVKPLLALLGVRKSGGQVNRAVYRAAYTYIAVIVGGLSTQFFYNIICCVLRSIGDSATPLLFLVLSSVLNIALDLLFILACGWGVAGAAVATVVSQAAAATACFVYTLVRYPFLRLSGADFKAVSWKYSGRMLWQSVPLGLQFSVLAFGLIIMTNGVIAFDKAADGSMVQGTPAQLGYSAACKIDNIFMTPLNALGTAMLSFCAQNHGAGKYDRIKKGCRQAIFLSFIVSVLLLCAGLLLSIHGAYQHIFLASGKISARSVRYGNVYLYSVLPFFTFLGILLVLRNAVQGVGKPLCPFLAGIAELIARIVVCLLLPACIAGTSVTASAPIAAFVGLSFADPIAWIAADIPLLIAGLLYIFRKKKTDGTEAS